MDELTVLFPYSEKTLKICVKTVAEAYNISQKECIRIILEYYATNDSIDYAVLFNILLRSTPSQLRNFCKVNKLASTICKSQEFRVNLFRETYSEEEVECRELITSNIDAWYQNYLKSGTLKIFVAEHAHVFTKENVCKAILYRKGVLFNTNDGEVVFNYTLVADYVWKECEYLDDSVSAINVVVWKIDNGVLCINSTIKVGKWVCFDELNDIKQISIENYLKIYALKNDGSVWVLKFVIPNRNVKNAIIRKNYRLDYLQNYHIKQIHANDSLIICLTDDNKILIVDPRPYVSDDGVQEPFIREILSPREKVVSISQNIDSIARKMIFSYITQSGKLYMWGNWYANENYENKPKFIMNNVKKIRIHESYTCILTFSGDLYLRGYFGHLGLNLKYKTHKTPFLAYSNILDFDTQQVRLLLLVDEG